MRDPYQLLNVPRSADAAQIKAAYRKLAKSLHPDRNPGDGRAEQRFKEVTRAYELLSDPEKRAQFDRGMIDAEGKPRAPFGFGGFEHGGARAGARTGAFESIFEKAFGGFGGTTGGFGGRSSGGAAFEELLRQGRPGGPGTQRRRVRGADIRHRLEIDFATAALGGRHRLQLEDDRTLEVEVPPGTDEGQILRLKGQGHQGFLRGEPGDLLIEVSIAPHPHFQRRGHDIHLDLPISLLEASHGAKITVPTIDGPVRVSVPPGSGGGQSLRLKGRGIARPDGRRGDQYVRLTVVLPEQPDTAASLRRWAQDHPYHVRRPFEG